MIARHKPLIALLSIALLAFDGVVGALGHHHGEALNSHDGDHVACHHSACNGDEDEHSSPADSAPAPHENCSLCRHFSQPVVVVAVTVDVVGVQRIEIIAPAVTPCIAAISELPHPARGPPALSA